MTANHYRLILCSKTDILLFPANRKLFIRLPTKACGLQYNNNFFYVTFHLFDIKTQIMCQIESNLFFFNVVVLRYHNIELLYALFV